MLAKEAIEMARESTNFLWEQYLQEKELGEEYISCSNPDSLYKKYIRTDEEILDEYIKIGIYIEDKEEYLNGRKQ